jgi:ubiquinone/menaquinone biosynthesis C-methylase UbiE
MTESGGAMTEADARFLGSIPSIYDRCLVPLMFEPYARDLAARLSDLRHATVVEVAAGTGAVTRVLAETLPDTVRIVATDLNDAMLSVGQSRVKRPLLTWQKADAQQLPFEDAFADALVSQFGVMFFPDKVAGYREAWRVLRPSGRYVFNVWDRMEENEVTLIVDRVVTSLFPDNPPEFMRRTPFGYFDVALIQQQLEAAGFRRIAVETVAKVSTAVSVVDAAVGICQGTPLRAEIEARDSAGLDRVTEAVKTALVERFGSSSFENRMSAHVVTAWRS